MKYNLLLTLHVKGQIIKIIYIKNARFVANYIFEKQLELISILLYIFCFALKIKRQGYTKAWRPRDITLKIKNMNSTSMLCSTKCYTTVYAKLCMITDKLRIKSTAILHPMNIYGFQNTNSEVQTKNTQIFIKYATKFKFCNTSCKYALHPECICQVLLYDISCF